MVDRHSNCNELFEHEDSGCTHANVNHEDINSNKRKCVDDDNKDTYTKGEVIDPITNDDENVLKNLSQPSNIIEKKQKVCKD